MKVTTLQDVLDREFGVKTFPRFNPENSSVAITPTLLLSNNPNRLAWVIVNLGLNDIHIGFDQEVSATNGILIANSGGGLNFVWKEEFNLVGYSVYAIATGGASSVYVMSIEATSYKPKPFSFSD